MDSIPSLSNGPVGSRFVTQDEIETARARKDEQWKAAYARLGQVPPPQQQEEVYDGRSLAEKLAANRIAKQEEWEERNKLANQFRALEEDEIMFLDSIREKQEEEERLRKETEGEELKGFREAVAARISSTATNPPPKPATTSKPPVPTKKEGKKVIKGIVVKKKAKPAAATPTVKPSESNADAKADASPEAASSASPSGNKSLSSKAPTKADTKTNQDEESSDSKADRKPDDAELPSAKRRRVTES